MLRLIPVFLCIFLPSFSAWGQQQTITVIPETEEERYYRKALEDSVRYSRQYDSMMLALLADSLEAYEITEWLIYLAETKGEVIDSLRDEYYRVHNAGWISRKSGPYTCTFTYLNRSPKTLNLNFQKSNSAAFSAFPLKASVPPRGELKFTLRLDPAMLREDLFTGTLKYSTNLNKKVVSFSIAAKITP